MLDDQLRAALERRARKGMLRALTNFPTSEAALQASAFPSSSSSTGSSSSASNSQAPAPLVDFSSNDYLSLSTSPAVLENFQRRARTQLPALGSGGSRLLDGNSGMHEELEQRLSTHFRSTAALLFNSGFDANVSLLSTLAQPGDIILYDALIHASAHDGMRSSRAKCKVPFRHNDVGDLESTLAGLYGAGSKAQSTAATFDEATRSSAREGELNVFLVVESVYSMDGDVAPLAEIVGVMKRFVPDGRRHIILDEAHSTCVYGDRGEGLAVLLGVEREISARLITFGKAMGCSGAAVLCSPLMRHYLINYARPLIFSTSMTYPSLLSIHSALDVLLSEGAARRSSLQRNISHLLPSLSSLASRDSSTLRLCAPSASTLRSPIVPLLTPRAKVLAAHLRERGYLVRSVTYPTVPKGEDRVRICLHAMNTAQQINGLVQAIAEWQEGQGKEGDEDGRAENRAKL